MTMGHSVVRFFLNSENLICRSTVISIYFRESLGVRDNESRLYLHFMTIPREIIQNLLPNYGKQRFYL